MRSILIMGIISLSAYGFQEDVRPPEIIRNGTQNYEVWYSLSLITHQNGELLTKDGESLESTLSDMMALRLRRMREVQENRLMKADAKPCIRNTGHVPLAENFNRVMRRSRLIFVARVLHAEPGFYNGSPVELLTLEIEMSPIRFPEHLQFVPRDSSQHFYLVKHIVTFDLANVHLCTKDDRFVFGDDNQVGKRFMIFAPDFCSDELGAIIHTGYHFIFGENENGELIVPPDLLGDPDLTGIHTFDEFVDYVEKISPQRPVTELLVREMRR